MIINIGIYVHSINGIVIYFGKNTIRLCFRGGWVGGLEVWEITILINIVPYFTHRYWQMSTSMLVYPRVDAAAF